MNDYLLTNSQVGAPERLQALGRIFDPITFGHFQRLGVTDGWRCWEVGAGGSSVAEGLSRIVGTSGQVVASDIDLTHVLGRGFMAVQHDIGTDPAPGDGFDLVHARLVLVHVRRRDEALATMAAALRPGGWLLVEDADPGLQPLLSPDEHGPAERLANHVRRGFRTLLAERGADLEFGRTLPRRLRGIGLADVAADAYFPITSPDCVILERATIAQVGAQLVERRLATTAELAEHLANVAGGKLDLTTAPLVSAWGRRTD